MIDHTRPYDLIALGRSSIDLYANQTGPFTQIQSFGAFVGGCPTNIAVGTRRLGLKSALLTAVGEDAVGDFILNFLNLEDVDIRWIPKKRGHRSSAVVLGIEPPDKFPLVFYRDNCADIELTMDDVMAVPFEHFKLVMISGTGFSKEPSRSATLFALERAREAGCKIVLDLDFRPDQWHDSRAFGVTIRSILPKVDLVIGTGEEVKAAVMQHASSLHIRHGTISDARVEGDLTSAIQHLLSLQPPESMEPLIVKQGSEGASAYFKDGDVLSAKPFSVEVLNVLGAGDAFASGLLYGYLRGWDWEQALRMGNATGAIVVTRQGCANFMPTEQEALAMLEGQRGLSSSPESEVMSCPR